MRIWSLHPNYLDSKGLVALWRETLLAQNVLLDKTKGYKNHPQLKRFKTTNSPIDYLATYLHAIVDEAESRNYNFNRTKIVAPAQNLQITVTQGQLEYEFQHLQNKLKIRDPERFEKHQTLTKLKTHPLFTIIKGNVEDWEIIHNQ